MRYPLRPRSIVPALAPLRNSSPAKKSAGDCSGWQRRSGGVDRVPNVRYPTILHERPSKQKPSIVTTVNSPARSLVCCSGQSPWPRPAPPARTVEVYPCEVHRFPGRLGTCAITKRRPERGKSLAAAGWAKKKLNFFIQYKDYPATHANGQPEPPAFRFSARIVGIQSGICARNRLPVDPTK
jgi:hypothetical protein